MSKVPQSRQLKYKLKELLENNGISQPTLAKYLDVSFKTIFNWCNLDINDLGSIPGDQLIRIAFLFEKSIEELHNERHFEFLTRNYNS
jgi:transcriptional regulator with XRE-family HTH domain